MREGPQQSRSGNRNDPMPEYTFELSDGEAALIERVREHKGLETTDQAAEWLIKTRLRRLARQSNGRGRALYAVALDREAAQ